MGRRLRVPVECSELAEVVAREHGHIHGSLDFSAAATIRLLDRLDAWRKPQRIDQILQACACDARGRLGLQDRPYPQADRLRACLQTALAVDTTAVAQAAQAEGLRGPAIGQRIHEARVKSLCGT